MKKFKSLNFKDHEIKGITYENGEKIVHLKEGIRRKIYKEDIWNTEEQLDSQLNQQLINYEKWDIFYRVVMGEEDYENDY